MVVEGAMTGEMFLAYVENCLVPTLQRNDIVVMDNCRVHLGDGMAGLSKQWARHCVTCQIFARPQSHRDALQQIQDIPASSGSANHPKP